jgi:putative ABC transport system ATP-binding protein
MDSDALAELRNSKIGFVFQQFNLLPRTTALDNVAVPLIYRGVGRAERQETGTGEAGSDGARRAARSLAGEALRRPAAAGGDRAGAGHRAAAAARRRADRRLDSQTSEEIMHLFQTLNDAGNTIVLVTHEREIADHASRRITFRDGKVIEDAAVTSRRLVRP